MVVTDTSLVRAARPAEAGPTLLARWMFDGADNAPIQDEVRRTAAPIMVALPRVAGVLGNAVQLTGNHALRVASVATGPRRSGIAFSVWVKPTNLGGYREIFRQECAERLLFSFQNNGTIVSLGLNVGGYVECDAHIDPADVLDGAWHHCAATFDGRTMRVYLDGTQIGSLDRPVEITTNVTAPAFIGSSSGHGEFFQGALDDLRIYTDALTGQQITALYQRGLDALSVRFARLERRVKVLYHRGGSFAETLASIHAFWVGEESGDDRELIGFMLAKLKTDFPGPYHDFIRATGSAPLQFFGATDPGHWLDSVRHLVDLMVEYRPLTQQQWAKLDSQQRKFWHDVDRLQTEFEEKTATGGPASVSPAWIDLILDISRHVTRRPSVAEAVAPYRKPATPETRDLPSSAARATLERDWLFQAGGQPSRARIEQEITWTHALADRIQTEHPGAVDFTQPLRELDKLRQLTDGADDHLKAVYYRVRQIKRSIFLANPAIDFHRLLFVDMPFPAGSEWPHQTRHRLGYMAVPGARLLVLDGLSPAGHLTQLMPRAPLHGSFWRPDLSFDAQHVLFCFKPHNEKSFHLYRIRIDGSDLEQLTDGPYDDLDPIFLPDGRHIMFSTTRSNTYVRCMPPTNAFVLARCDIDGNNIYLISRNNEPDYLPAVLEDGRVVYTRWEYTDKPLWRAQGLWTVNPDGTQVNTLWGNQSVWPDLLKDAREIPGSDRIMFTGSAHHNWFSGSIGIIDPKRGFNFPNGLTKVTAEVPWPESGNGPVDPIESPTYHKSGAFAAYYSPYPLGAHDFLVSAKRNGKFLLYLMDVDGNRELLYEGVHNIFHAIPVRPRRRPPVIADRVDWPTPAERLTPHDGVIFSTDVCEGVPPAMRAKVSYLRVLNIEPKTYTYWYKRPYLSTGPVVSAVQSEGVKRILGTVPIQPDGSVAFRAPAGMALHFQLLDNRFRALQTMRSFTGVMPGERRGCLGCHESHSTTPVGHLSVAALAKSPEPIQAPPWGDESVSYTRFVRPTLDRYCAKCHQGDAPGRAALDLTHRPGLLFFDQPYMTLTGQPSWGTAYHRPARGSPGLGIANMLMVEGYEKTDPRAYQTPLPMTHLSYNSRLIEIAASGTHYDVVVDPLALRKLIAWVDTMCPYRGAEEVRQIDDPEFQGVDWLSIRPRIKSAPTIVRPGPMPPD